MFNFGESLKQTYNQILQPNPIEWEVLWQDEMGVLQPQTARFKCRDFFNDIVAMHHGHNGGNIYGMDVTTIKRNEGFIFVRLFNLKSSFYDQLKLFLDPYLEQQKQTPLEVHPLSKTCAVIKFQGTHLESTYNISFLTFLIRLCNYGNVFSSLEESVVKYPQMWADERVPLPSKYADWAVRVGFNVPEDMQGSWFYYNEKATTKGGYKPMLSVVHNTGWRGSVLTKIQGAF